MRKTEALMMIFYKIFFLQCGTIPVGKEEKI